MNLDPFDKYSDRDVWTALDQSHLGSYVRNLPGELFFEVKTHKNRTYEQLCTYY